MSYPRPDMPSGERFHSCHVTGMQELFPKSDCVLCRERDQEFQNLLRLCEANQKKLRASNDTRAIEAHTRNVRMLCQVLREALARR